MSKEVEEAINAIENDIYDLKGFLTESEKIKWQKSIDTVLNYIKELEETLKCTQNSWYNDTKKIQELEEEIKQKDMEHELELIGKEEYTKASMGKIIEQYYTANENCISKQVIRDKIEELRKEKLKYDNEIRIYTMRESFNFQEMILNELLEEE